MSNIGIQKELDSLGRLVIPKEFRQLYRLEQRVELITTKEGLLLRNPQYVTVPKKLVYKKKS